MSRSVDLFLATELPLHDLAVQLGQQAGCRLNADPERPQWVLKDGAVTAVLAEHPYVNDAGLPLAKYRYAISARVPNDTRPSDTPEAALLRKVAQRIQEGPKWPVLLVHDLQYRDGSGGAGTPSTAETGDTGDSGDTADTSHTAHSAHSEDATAAHPNSEPAGTVAP